MTDVIKDHDVELWDIDRLIPYEKNAKNHPKDQVKKIAASIQKYGWANAKAIEVDAEGVIINGHGRRLAAIQLGLKKVPVIVRSDLSPEEVKAYRLTDNRTAESSYDTDLLAGELFDLRELDVDMSEFFSEREFNFMVEDLGEMDMTAISGSIDAEVQSHAENTENAITEADSKLSPVSEAFGFKTVTGEELRKLNLFRIHVESVTNLTGAAAFIAFAQDFVGVEL